MTLVELHDELRSVAREVLGAPSWDRFAAAGWFGLEVPEARDGAGATFAETAVVLEEVGRAAAPGPFLGTVLGAAAIDGDLQRRVAAGEVKLAVALSPSGEDAVPRPAFTLDGDRVSGRSAFVVDALDADKLLLVAGDRLVCVDPSQAQLAERSVLDATRRFADVVVDGAEVEGSWLVDAQALLDRAALAVAWDALGVAAAMLDATVEYAQVRRQFDAPIGSFQAVKHQCADMLVRVTLGRELLRTGDAVRGKAYVGQAAVDVVGTALQLHGGIGYTWESGLHVHLKRALLDRAFFGAPAAQRQRLVTRR